MLPQSSLLLLLEECSYYDNPNMEGELWVLNNYRNAYHLKNNLWEKGIIDNLDEIGQQPS